MPSSSESVGILCTFVTAYALSTSYTRDWVASIAPSKCRTLPSAASVAPRSSTRLTSGPSGWFPYLQYMAHMDEEIACLIWIEASAVYTKQSMLREERCGDGMQLDINHPFCKHGQEGTTRSLCSTGKSSSNAWPSSLTGRSTRSPPKP